MTLGLRLKIGLIVGATFITAGCDRVPGTEAYRFRVAKEQVSRSFTDSQSAQFKFIWTGKDGKTVCGKVTARNEYGGYPDPVRFFAPPLDNDSFVTFIEGATDPAAFYHFEMNWYGICEKAMDPKAVDEMLRVLEQNN